ncbi:helix-turn-helix transcriptional regulator [Tunturiibacter lichenicola]|jgi:AraC-like DNA-binding protein|uniref:helix-turn-helix transcriptional regulator n=1 Tax=Tunturiibacter lichenicola TaxID=2051959 RepID=UPI0036F3F875
MMEYIHANASGNISLADLATIAEVTPHHLASLFTKTTGLSPHQYVLRVRIERSKIHLKNEGLSIAEVSRLVGFRTQEHFTKVFRRVVGVTPSKFRQELADGVDWRNPLA